MHYEFTELEHLVTVLISPAHLKSEQLTGELFSQYALDCYNEIEKVKKRFRLATLTTGDENHIKLYIHQHQACLIKFADSMYLWLQAGELQHPDYAGQVKNVLTFYKEVYKDLNELLLFLEKSFAKYFDWDARLTLLCNEEFAIQVKRNLEQLKLVLKKNTTGEDLAEIIGDSLENLESADTAITYRTRTYYQLLLKEISNLERDGATGLRSEQLTNLLLGLNYNNNRFYNYLIRELETSAGEINNKDDLLAFYLLKMKRLNQTTIKTTTAFNPELPDIRQQVGNWMSEEINFLEKKPLIAAGLAPEQESKLSKQKIHTTLAVSQLSLALKLLVDSGIIVNDNNTDLTKMVALSFKTDRSENISEDSLRNKYYNIEKATADKMKDVVANLLNLVRQY